MATSTAGGLVLAEGGHLKKLFAAAPAVCLARQQLQGRQNQ
ncbi:MAG: hypothetical protein ACRYF0_13375 [Janthinobacterium lividum]